MNSRLRNSLTLCLFLVLGASLAACRASPTATYRPLGTASPTLKRLTATTIYPVLPTETSTLVPLPSASLTATPTATPAPTDTAVVVPTQPPSLWLGDLPDSLQQALPPVKGLSVVAKPEEASLRLSVGNQDPIAQWVYALVAPFPTIPDGVSSTDLMNAWSGQASGPFAGLPLLMDNNTYRVLTTWWGMPGEKAIQVLPAAQLLDTAWADRPSWAIIPFEAIEPRWKVLQVDGQSPMRKDFDPRAYLLTVPISLTGAPEQVAAVRSAWASLPASNRDPAKLTTVMLTGVTALVRGTAWTMEQKGILYPDQDIRDLLRGADILHISNEVPFDPNCPRPDPKYTGLIFCSNPSYIALMEDIGTDVVELTGDHFADYGPQATLYTIDLYRKEGWPYYGGGVNLADARKPALFENNGNKIAFLGCNAKGGGYATASDTNPGAGKCDFAYMTKEVQTLRADGYLPIVTFQHQETANLEIYRVLPEFRPDFEAMAAAGAVIVSGSQAHQPLNFEFDTDGPGGTPALIHYGLGNLFFDQYHYYSTPITDRAFLDRHVFYDGRYMGVELLTIQFVDLARSRPTTPEERTDLLQAVFRGSGW